MKSVMKKKDLIEVIKSNRKAHRAQFEKAFEGYCVMLREQLEKMLKAVKARKPVSTYISLVAPRDQTVDYERILAMLDRTINETVELTEEEFQQYVLDQWEWTAAVTASNSFYLSH